MPTINLADVEFHNSPNVTDWAETATITRLEFRPTGVHVEHTKNVGPGAWPNFRRPGWDGDLQYTLWLVTWINNHWHGSGGIQFWQDCDQNGGDPEHFAENWFYAADRWGVMTGHQPPAGVLCGFLVTAGDARNNGMQTVQERSDVVCIPFPRSGDVYVPEALPPEVVPPRQPPIVDGGDTVPPWAHQVLERLGELERLVSRVGNPSTVVHLGARVNVSGTVRILGPVSGSGTIVTTNNPD